MDVLPVYLHSAGVVLSGTVPPLLDHPIPRSSLLSALSSHPPHQTLTPSGASGQIYASPYPFCCFLFYLLTLICFPIAAKHFGSQYGSGTNLVTL